MSHRLPRHPASMWLSLLVVVLVVGMCESRLVVAASGLPDAGTPGQQSEQYFDKAANELVRSAVPEAERKYLVDTGARLIAPSKDCVPTFDGGRTRAYVQFQQTLNSEQRSKLKQAGIRFHQALGNFTYVATVKQTAWPELQAHPLFRGAEPVVYADKLPPAVYFGRVRPHVVQSDGTWAAHVRFYDGVSLQQALALVDGLGLRIPDRSRLLLDNRLLVHGTQAQLIALARQQAVAKINLIPAPPRDDNTQAAGISNIDDLQTAPYNLDGTGVNFGQWESGTPLASHQDLTPRVTIVESTNTGDHATHVCGTIIASGANNAAALGMSFNGEVFSYRNNGDVGTEMDDAATNEDIIAANHSWGISNTDGYDPADADLFGRYQDSARGWDLAIASKGLIVGNSSGNDNDDCDGMGNCDGLLGDDGNYYDTIDSAGVAKNNITVGNLNDDAVNISGSSSTGPADDGRIKPDLVANGQSLFSTSYDDTNPGNNAFYQSKSGTSMATPTVIGACGLLIERWRDNNGGNDPRPEMIKALLVNTATDLGLPGPDYTFGHGLLNALLAVETLDLAEIRIMQDTVDQGNTNSYFVLVNPGQPELRVTLAWTDPAGESKEAPSSDPDLVNNLDLLLISPGGQQVFPFSGPNAGQLPNASLVGDPATATGPNNVDNVEHARVTAPEQGFWEVRVGGTAVPEGPQDYALVSNFAFLVDDVPDIRVNAPLSFNELCAGEFQDVVVSIFNTGGADLLVDAVEVTAGVADFSLYSHPTQPFVVRPGAVVELTVRFLPMAVGMRMGTLQIRSNDIDEPVLDLPMAGMRGSPDIDIFMADAGNFGTVCAGSFLDLPITITNSGECYLTVTGVTSDDAEFIVAGPPIEPVAPLVIAPGDTAQVPVRFQPALPYGSNPRNAGLTITSDDPATPNLLFSLTGRLGEPAVEAVIANSGSFGDVCAGSFRDLPLTIANRGDCNLTVTGLVSSDAQFLTPGSQVSPASPLVIAPSTAVQVPVRFQPALPFGPKSAVLTLATDATNEAGGFLDVAVSGNYPAPVIDITPCPIEFGEVCPSDTEGQSKIIQICNVGLCPLTIAAGGIRFEPATTEFEISDTIEYPVVVYPGSECYPFSVKFTPTSAGDKSATLVVEAEGGLTATCQVTATAPDLSDGLMVPSRLAFPPTVIEPNGPCGSELDLQIMNQHAGCEITVNSVVITGPDAALFSLVNLDSGGAMPITLMPGEILGDGNLRVKFTPVEVVTKRFLTAQVEVTFVADPSTNPPVTETLIIPMAGEGVRSGMRVLVTIGGVPVDNLMSLQVRSMTGRQRYSLRNLPLKIVAGPAGFEDVLGFQYHAEFGGMSSPTQRLTGNYRVTAKVRNGRRSLTRYVNLSIDTCTFNNTVKIDF